MVVISNQPLFYWWRLNSTGMAMCQIEVLDPTKWRSSLLPIAVYQPEKHRPVYIYSSMQQPHDFQLDCFSCPKHMQYVALA